MILTAILFIRLISTVVVSITDPSCIDTATYISALERARSTRSSF